MRIWGPVIAVLGLLALPALALDLDLPSTAQQTATRDSQLDVFTAPRTVFEDDGVETIRIEGAVSRTAWRIASPGLTALQVIRPVRDALVSDGYDIILDCAARRCGGYDFRFQVETLPAPSMFVNIRAYHHVTAVKGDHSAPQEVVSVLTSTSASAAHLQVIRAVADGSANVAAATTRPTPAPTVATPTEPSGDVTSDLISQGFFILDTLDFATGTTNLGPGENAQLQALAALMQARTDLSFALVGHTDSTGSLQANIDISRQRATSVRQRLVEAYGVDPGRIRAEGMGYLSPIASNLDAAGREANRRVEVIVVGPN